MLEIWKIYTVFEKSFTFWLRFNRMRTSIFVIARSHFNQILHFLHHNMKLFIDIIYWMVKEWSAPSKISYVEQW